MQTTSSLTETDINASLDKLDLVSDEIGKVIVGQHTVVQQLMISLLAGGHCLLEGVPGLAKTLMVSSLADALAMDFKRIQFTPDLMPSDIIGTEILETDHASGERFFKFQKGPVFTQILLADEINRTPAKTQAALLEAMQERHVSYAGEQHDLPKPFFVLATQNPVEQAGTYPLPEAQLDRFLMYVKVSYPSYDEEIEILQRTTGASSSSLEAQLSGEELLDLQRIVRQVEISQAMMAWAVDLVQQTRPQTSSNSMVKEYVQWGAGPRCGQALVLCAKAHALIQRRFAVTKEDIEAVAPAVMRHRLLLNFQAEAQAIDVDSIISHLLTNVSVAPSPID
ncbi:AAA family ATPase [Alteromonas facilis]|uniref:AAA family ATPase n=1 Tax=Alteromonas facilis TaxID=2048004 RepID=UPI000C28709F|nr:MoxR family ATPase [Alteromonas facilis]